MKTIVDRLRDWVVSLFWGVMLKVPLWRVRQWAKQHLVAKALSTPQGRQALVAAMVEPMKDVKGCLVLKNKHLVGCLR